MKKASSQLYIVKSVSELHRLHALPLPCHPLVSVIDFVNVNFTYHPEVWNHFANDFYCIVLKRGVSGKFRYGQNGYDFDAGMMSFTRPRQVFSVTEVSSDPVTGYMLVFKADLIRQYPLGKTIDGYGFFSYSVAEALHLSEREEKVISSLLLLMQEELKTNIDNYSQDIIVSHLDMLLNYANRFYNRQFITRKVVNHDLLTRIEQALSVHFSSKQSSGTKLPTVQWLAEQVHVSAEYMSDMLRHLTGQGAQQYIHHYLVEEAKALLSTTRLGISEIAYQLGFEYPQSFSKLFKKKTHLTPVEYRQSLN